MTVNYIKAKDIWKNIFFRIPNSCSWLPFKCIPKYTSHYSLFMITSLENLLETIHVIIKNAHQYCNKHITLLHSTQIVGQTTTLNLTSYLSHTYTLTHPLNTPPHTHTPKHTPSGLGQAVFKGASHDFIFLISLYPHLLIFLRI